MDRPRWPALAESAAPWLGGALLALPMLLVSYPPMGDLGSHEGLAAILCHWGDPRWNPPGLYRAFIPQANQLFTLLVAALGFVIPTDVASRWVVAAIFLASTVGLSRLLAHLRLSRWLSLLVAPVLYGWMFNWGLAPNLAGFAVMVLSLPALERYAEGPSVKGLLLASAWVTVAFLGHESAAVACGVFVGILAVARGRDALGVATRGLPVVVVLGLLAVQSEVSRALIGDVMKEIGTSYATPVTQRLRMVPSAIFGSQKPRETWELAALCVVALAASALRFPLVKHRVARGLFARRRYALFALALFFLYLAFPMALGGATMLAFRFVPALAVGVIVACARRRTRPVAILAACLVPIAVVLTQYRAFVKADATYSAQDRVIARIELGSSVAQLDWSPRRASRIPSVFNDRVLASRGGRVLFSFADKPPNPIYIPPNLQWNEPVRRLATNPYAFMPTFDFHRFEYVLARCDYPPLVEPIVALLQREGELVARDGIWLLFRSRLAPWPLVSDDVPVPEPTPVTLGQRLQAATEAHDDPTRP